MPLINRITLLYLCLSMLNASAADSDLTSQSNPESSCTLASYLDEQCIELQQFDLSIALGYGQKQNPYQYRDHIPLLVLADFSFYYGNWFIDNGTVGYSIIDTHNASFNIIGHLADDSAYFHKWHFSNITTTQSVSDPNESQNPDTEIPTGGDLDLPTSGDNFTPPVNKGDSLDQPSITPLTFDIQRSMAVNAGIEYNRFYEHGSYHVRFSHDVSGVHKGYGLTLEASYPWSFNHFKMINKVGVQYKSDRWLDYYYGVTSTETNDPRYIYKASGGFSPFTEMTMLYPINSHWSIISNVKIEQLSDEVIDSPLVNRKSLIKWFTGVSYHF